MIPYDDLVAALASWRTRQGLPTGQLAGVASAGPPAAPKPAAQAAPPAPAPPAPARSPSGVRPAAAVVVEHTHDDHLDVDEAALLEEASFDSDFAMSFNTAEPGESTAIGVAPSPRPADDVDDGRPRPPPPRRGGR
jgi:hypothetical protein